VVTDAMRVRPSLRRFLLWVGPVLALIAVWQVWDAVERNRLERQLAATFPEGLVDPDRSLGGENAARYYKAAAAAVLWPTDTRVQSLPVLWATRGAIDRGEVPTVSGSDAAVKLVAENQLSLDLIERAGALPFGAFRPGTDSNYRFGDLLQLATLSAFKTLDAIRRSDVSASVASVTARIKLLRALDAEDRAIEATMAAREREGIAADTALLVSRAQLSDVQLDALSQALREIAPTDLDHVIKRDGLSRYDAFRYGSFDRGAWYQRIHVFRPIVRHHVVESMKLVAEVREAVRLPWPDRLEAMKSIPDRRSWFPEVVPFIGAWRLQSVWRDMMPRVAAGVAATRCARLAVALEQHRRSHGAYPQRLDELTQDLGSETRVDPFTEKPFVYQPSKTGYLLYSIGPDGRDDGGQVFPVPVNGRVLGTVPAPDVGVRVS
jgi:hypothetical protein